MSIYGSLVYMSGAIGGWISDRIWGSRRTVFLDGVLIMFGHIALSLPFGIPSLYASIALIVIGTGLMKPNISSMVGDLYSEEDKRRDAGFSMFVFAANFGAAVAPWAVPRASNGFGLHLFGAHQNFHAGFSLAAIGMFFGLLQYYFGGRKTLSKIGLYPSDPLDKESGRRVAKWVTIIIVILIVIFGGMAMLGQLNITNIINLITVIAIALPIGYFIMMISSKKVTKVERSRVIAYIPLFYAAAIFWGIEESRSTILALFAAQRTILHVGGWHFAAANFQTLNPLFIMLLTPFFVWLWDHWKGQPSAPGRFTIGMVVAGLSYVWMAIPGILFGTSGKVSPLWLVGSWFVVEVAEMLISPVGSSITTKLAPQAFKSQMMSLWFMTDAVGQAINAQIVKFYSTANEVPYFFAVGLVSILFGVVLAFFVKRIHALMQGVD